MKTLLDESIIGRKHFWMKVFYRRGIQPPALHRIDKGKFRQTMNHCWQSFPSRFNQFQTHCRHRWTAIVSWWMCPSGTCVRGCVPCHQPSSTLWRTIWRPVQCPLCQQVLWQSVVWAEIAHMLTVRPWMTPRWRHHSCRTVRLWQGQPTHQLEQSEDWCW